MAKVVIHTNMALANQRETAGWLRDGFKKHGIDAVITPDRDKPADVHVIQGPWYAYKHWIGKPNVLWLNRSYYGHGRWDVSLGWLNADGTRDFRWKDEPRRAVPELADVSTKRDKECCAIVFGDYGESPTGMVHDARSKYGRVYYRPHPADGRESPALAPDWTLEQCFEIADVAVGGKSTVLVDAMVNGLRIDCHDPLHVLNQDADRETVMARLSWADWNFEDIKRGEAWEHLCTN